MTREDYIELIRTDSDRVMQNTFMFQNPWDMERTDFPYSFSDSIDWDLNPKGDPEWTFMLARHGFIPNLAKAEYLFHDRKYGDKAIELIHDFIDNAPLTEERKATSWRSLDSAIRVTNWIDSIEIIDKARGQEVLDYQIINGIRAHIEYLKTFDNTFLKLSNWGAIGNAGLFKASCYLEDWDGMEIAHRQFLETITNQVFPDGFQWEQSSMYQAEVLLHTLDYIRTADRYALTLEREILDAASGMARAFLDMRKPDGKQFMQSDSDSTDLEDIIAKSAFVLSDGLLKWAVGGKLDFDYEITASDNEIRKYKALKETPPDYTSATYPISGHTYLRSNWTEKGSVIHIKTASHGGGHGHGDILHVDASLDGVDVLVDSGRYTYVDSPIRHLLKLASRHNTVLIDEIEPFIPTDSWGYSRYARGIGMSPVFRDDWSYQEAGTLGFMEEGILPLRKVILLNDILVILDKFEGKGRHKVTRPFLFDIKKRLETDEDHFRFGEFSIFTDSKDCQIEEREISYRYNTLEKTDALILNDELSSNEMRYIVIGKNVKKVESTPVSIYKGNKILPSTFARGLSIKLKDGEDIDILSVLTCEVNGAFLLETGSIRGAHGTLVIQQGNRRETLR